MVWGATIFSSHKVKMDTATCGGERQHVLNWAVLTGLMWPSGRAAIAAELGTMRVTNS